MVRANKSQRKSKKAAQSKFSRLNRVFPEPAQLLPQVAGETPETSELYSLCQKILPPETFELIKDKYGGEDAINILGLKLKPNDTWSTGSIGIFADIVGSLFDHILKRAIIQ